MTHFGYTNVGLVRAHTDLVTSIVAWERWLWSTALATAEAKKSLQILRGYTKDSGYEMITMWQSWEEHICHKGLYTYDFHNTR